MTKQTKMIIGVGVVAIGGYLLYKRSTKSFASATGKIFANASGQRMKDTPCKKYVGKPPKLVTITYADGTTESGYECKGDGVFSSVPPQSN